MAPQQTPLWLDCDTGHDDALAILLAARHPDVHLLGLSTVFGNAPLTKTTYNTRAILKAIGREDVPVYVGAAKPFCREVVHSPEIHGESGLDGTTLLPVPEAPVRTDKTAVQAMYDALMATEKGTAWLVVTGPITNAALLFAEHPDLVDHIGGVSVMGGAIGGEFTDAPLGTMAGEGERFGNITASAEFNIYIDPEAAKSVLMNPALACKTSLITLDVTHKFLATKEVQGKILGKASEPSVVRKLFVEILVFFAKTYANVFGITAGPPVHDPLAVVAAFAPTLFGDNEGERFEVEVVTDGTHSSFPTIPAAASQCGRTIATPTPGTDGVRIPRAVDANAVWHMLEQCLSFVDEDGSSG